RDRVGRRTQAGRAGRPRRGRHPRRPAGLRARVAGTGQHGLGGRRKTLADVPQRVRRGRGSEDCASCALVFWLLASRDQAMPKIADLARLFRALSLKDWASASAVAEQIADAEDTAGHHVAAKTLRGALSGTGPRTEVTEDEPASHPMFVPDVLTEIREVRSLDTVELNNHTRRL